MKDEALAAALPSQLYLGTSSWNFTGWRGILYERDTAVKDLSGMVYVLMPLGIGYAAWGLTGGYYNPVPREDWEFYRAQVPGHFRFMIKALQRVLMPWIDERGNPSTYGQSENPHFLDARLIRETLVQPAAEALEEMLGPILFQFAPMPPEALGGAVQFCERLDRFLGNLPQNIDYVVELRTPGLFTRRYLKTLARHRATHSAVIHPAMTGFERQVLALQSEKVPFKVNPMDASCG